MLTLLLLAASIVLLPAFVHAESIRRLNNPAPDGAQETYQLTDGRVLAQSYRHNPNFWVLTPHERGSYVNGTLKQVASLPPDYSPVATASQVLADGRVLVEGR